MDVDFADTGDAERLLRLGRSLTSNLDLESLLREIIVAASELTDAEFVALGILNSERDGLERFITHGVDAELRAEIGELPSGHGVLGVLIEDPQPLRLSDLSDHPKTAGFPPHHPPMKSFLGVPILIGDTAYGNLYLTNKAGGEFDDRDEDAVVTLAAWAAIAIQNAKSVRDDRLRAAIEGSENERKRWARELHDETLQSLGAIHLLLSSALRRGDQESLERAAREGGEQLHLEITNLRSLITELRPAALDEIGLAAALEGLARRMSSLSDLAITLDGDLLQADSLPDHLRVTLYRIIQEAISNAAKHSSAESVRIEIFFDEDRVRAVIRDDGDGFNAEDASSGFGIVGMRERAMLSSGELEIDSHQGAGTVVSVILPTSPAS